MKTFRSTTLRAAFALAALSGSAFGAQGCTAGVTTDEDTGVTESALRRVQSCGELNAELKNGAKKKLNAAIDAYRDGILKYGWRSFYSGGGYDSRGASDDAATSGNAAPSAGSSSSSSGSSGPPTAPRTDASESGGRATQSTQTNNQVEEVAEADIMQTDLGKYIYALHGRSLKVLDVWPATNMREVANLDIDGSPSEMITSDGKVVVFSTVDGTPIYKTAGVSPNDPDYQDPWATSGSSSSGSPPVDLPTRDGAGSTPSNPGGATPTAPVERYRPITKATVLRFDGAAIVVAAEYYFEGSYVSSRRIDNNVRAALEGWNDRLEQLTWPRFDNYGTPKSAEEALALLETVRAKGLSKIDAVDATGNLPRSFTKVGTRVTVESETCGDYFVPKGKTASGLTRIIGFDMTGTARPRSTSIVARAETVYSSKSSLYVASQAWDRSEQWAASWGVGDDVAVSGGTSGSEGSTSSGGGVPEAVPTDAPKPARANVQLRATPKVARPFIAINKTNIHKFSFAGIEPLYQGSGQVGGGLLNQFSLDDQDGYLRVATTAQRSNGYETKQDNHVFVMHQERDALRIVGNVGALAEGERIYSARFLGNKGYVVTFREVDPLFSIDFSDPRNPRVTGELKIPGFSSYIHPLDASHLLTIGRDTQDGGGRVTRGGLKLEIFDVSDPAHPASTQRWVDDADRYGYSDAENNHKAFTYFRERNLLAFPYAGSSNPGNYTSTLEIFTVSTTAGIRPVGNIDHSAFFKTQPSNNCGWYYDRSVRRGAFFASGEANYVYALSYGGIAAKSVNDLAGKGWALPFTAPVFDNTYYGGGYETGAALPCGGVGQE